MNTFCFVFSFVQSKKRRRKRAAQLQQRLATTSTNEPAQRRSVAAHLLHPIFTRTSLSTVQMALCYLAARTHRQHQPAVNNERQQWIGRRERMTSITS